MKKINADDIFVFPNNSNIILVSEQAAKISKNTTIIIPEHNIPAFKPAKTFTEQIK